jgi:hypothetical protein
MLDRTLLIAGASAFIDAHGARLSTLRGKEIRAIWLAWDVGRNEWFNDEAVVLEVEDHRAEIVFFGLDQIALTWNQIELRNTPGWVEDWSFLDAKLEWRPNPLPSLDRGRGARILDIQILEYRFRTVLLAHHGDHKPSERTESWLLHGIELIHDRGTLTIFNALDEAGVSDEPLRGEDYRISRL